MSVIVGKTLGKVMGKTAKKLLGDYRRMIQLHRMVQLGVSGRSATVSSVRPMARRETQRAIRKARHTKLPRASDPSPAMKARFRTARATRAIKARKVRQKGRRARPDPGSYD